MAVEPADALTTALAKLGHAAFRPGQREAIETLLDERRLLLVAPTGGGKSVCYQVPALVLPGVTLVVSPLIALMHDQVSGLIERGVRATFFASTLDGEDIRQRMAGLRRGDYQIVYAAPERLTLEGFRQFLSELRIDLLAVDEAHCISEWGHDFRPEYLRIGELLTLLPEARVLACTATATPVVRDEILARLGLTAETPQLVRGFARPNLSLQVRDAHTAKERQRVVDATLAEALGEGRNKSGTAIVYAPTRKLAAEEAERLRGRGWRADAYHAGLEGAERERVQNAFLRGELEVTVATNAFGMGIDRGDVRAVVHLAPPGSIEAYYQEVGRAGRDGGKGLGLMCLSASDVPLRRHLLGRPDPLTGEPPPQAIVEHKWQLFLELLRWAEGGSCRHDAILRYFGDEQEALAGCGRCDNCQQLASESDLDAAEAALVVRKALSGVARVHGRFGLLAAVQLVRGQADARLERTGLAKTRTFGILAQYDERWLLTLLRRCVAAGWVDFVGDERPIAVLTTSGRQIMQASLPVRLLLPPLKPRERTLTGDRQRPAGRSKAPPVELPPGSEALFAALRAERMRLAQSAGVPPYVIASDRTLRDIAGAKPRNLLELETVHGMGPVKLAQHGATWLEVVSSFRASAAARASSAGANVKSLTLR